MNDKQLIQKYGYNGAVKQLMATAEVDIFIAGGIIDTAYHQVKKRTRRRVETHPVRGPQRNQELHKEVVHSRLLPQCAH